MPGPDRRLLVVEDERNIRLVLEASLRGAGYRVEVASSGAEAIGKLLSEPYDGVVLDLGLPDVDGRVVIEQIRQESEVPIVVLSARSVDEKIAALDAGADDFVNKPFDLNELLARIRTALRSRIPRGPAERVLRLGDFELDLVERRVVIGGQETRLSKREHDFLCALAQHRGGVVTHRQLMSAVWGAEADVDTQIVRGLVAQVRHKVEADPGRPALVVTEPGLGYRLRVAEGP